MRSVYLSNRAPSDEAFLFGNLVSMKQPILFPRKEVLSIQLKVVSDIV